MGTSKNKRKKARKAQKRAQKRARKRAERSGTGRRPEDRDDRSDRRRSEGERRACGPAALAGSSEARPDYLVEDDLVDDDFADDDFADDDFADDDFADDDFAGDDLAAGEIVDEDGWPICVECGERHEMDEAMALESAAEHVHFAIDLLLTEMVDDGEEWVLTAAALRQRWPASEQARQLATLLEEMTAEMARQAQTWRAFRAHAPASRRENPYDGDLEREPDPFVVVDDSD